MTHNEIKVIKQGPRAWDAPDEFTYRGSHVVLKQWTHKYEGLLVTQVVIDNVCYPFLHRSKQGAQETAMRILDRRSNERATGNLINRKMEQNFV